MRKATNSITVALVAVGSAALAASPALAAKDDKKDSGPGKVKTEIAQTSTSADNQFVTVTAECGKDTKVVGGGFVSTDGGANDFNLVTESRRASAKSWVVSAYRFDAGGAGPVLPLTAEAYCRSGIGKISEIAVTAPAGTAANTPQPDAPCAFGKTVSGGGFSFLRTNFNNVDLFHYMSRPIAKVGWTVGAVTTGTATASTTAYAYCQKGKPLAQQTGAGQLPSNNVTIAAVDTAPCAGKRSATSGGFQAPDLFSGGVIPLWVESRRAEKSWHVAVRNIAGGNPPGFLAFALCS